MGLVILALLGIGSAPGWAQLTKTMTIALNGTGTGSVTSVPVGLNCPASACSASFPTLTSLVLVFTPAAGSAWTTASGDCSSTGFQTVVVNYTLVLDTNKACTITFAAVQNSLSVTLAGSGSGTVTSSPAGIACSAGSCSASFNQGTAVTLTASPGAGSTFAGWSGACSGTGPGTTITLSADAACTATFAAATKALSVTLAGSGSGTVTSSPAGIACSAGTCSASFSQGTAVTLTASPGTGSSFAGWSGACSGGLAATVITVNANTSCTATFTAATKILAVTVAGNGGGAVTSSPAGIACSTGTCSASFAQGASVSLSAAPNGGSIFAGWSGACSGSASAIAIVVSADMACTATFALGGKTLSVSLAGTGRGTVTSAPAGINCASGSDQSCSAGFAVGTAVTLTARPAIGSGFIGWTGACAATGRVTAGVTLAADAACTASFGAGTERPETGWWWNAAESGRGYSIEASDTGGSLHLFFAMYTYTLSGDAVWYVATLPLAADGSAFSGTLLRYDGGTGLLIAYRPPADGRAVGKDGRAVQVSFATPRTGTILLPPPDDSLPETTVAIQRFAFVRGGLDIPPPGGSGLPAGGWWWSPSRSGQGLFIELQSDGVAAAGTAYVAVFHYRSDGAPVWHFGAAALVQVGGVWSLLGMPLKECAGGPFLGAIGPRRFDCQPASAGPITLQFGANGTEGSASLVNGVELAIQRFSF